MAQQVYCRILVPRGARARECRLPGERTTDEILVHPDEPEVLWVRLDVRPAADGSRVREIASAGVLSVA